MSDVATAAGTPSTGQISDAGTPPSTVPAGSGSGGPVPASGAPDVQDWRSGLPEDLRSAPSLASIKTVPDLAKSFVNAQRALGNNVPVPGKDAPAEEWNAFYAKVGRPETPDKYDLQSIEGADKFQVPDEQLASYRTEAHRLGLSQRQMAGLYQFFVKHNIEQSEQITAGLRQQAEEGISGLRREWGEAYDERIGLARNAAREFGGEEMIQILNESGYGNHPAFIKMFAQIGKAVADDKMYGRGQDQGGGRLTPSEALAQIGTLQSNGEFMKAYTTKDDPGHEAAVEKIRTLYRAAYPA